MTILIVDDNNQMRDFIKKILSRLGHIIFEAVSGETGIESFKVNHQEVVLMDIRMTGIDGIEAAARIRKCSSETKIIMITDYNDNLLREKAKAAGANDYVLKENLLDLKEMLKN